MLSNYLAEIWGISIVAVSLALLLKDGHLRRFLASLETEDKLFSYGLVSFVIGITMVLAHNIWVKDWYVIITILGWISLVKGLSALFIPKIVQKWAKKIESAKWLPIALVITLLVGLVITYLGFTA